MSLHYTEKLHFYLVTLFRQQLYFVPPLNQSIGRLICQFVPKIQCHLYTYNTSYVTIQSTRKRNQSTQLLSYNAFMCRGKPDLNM